jgi:hypothetical protein
LTGSGVNEDGKCSRVGSEIHPVYAGNKGRGLSALAPQTNRIVVGWRTYAADLNVVTAVCTLTGGISYRNVIAARRVRGQSTIPNCGIVETKHVACQSKGPNSDVLVTGRVVIQ